MGVKPKKHISSLKKVVHGGPDHLELERLGLDPEEMLDFSANINPFGPPEAVLKIVSEIPLEKYPDLHAIALRRAVARTVGVRPEEVLPGNGVSELIWLVANAYLAEGDPVMVVGPTFGEYAAAALAMGSRVYRWDALPESDFLPSVDEIARLIRETSPKLLFLCNPNNPTGRYLRLEEVRAILESWEEGILVLDEAYVSFVEESWSSVPLVAGGRAIIMRSLTKDCALAGIRVGYVIATEEVTEALGKIQPPWSVNALAQAAGRVALECRDHVEKCLEKLRRARDYLIRSFSDLGFKVVPPAAHYFMVEVGDAAAFRRELLMKGLLVRDCTSFGLPAFIRVSPRSMEESRKLVEAVSALSKIK